MIYILRHTTNTAIPRNWHVHKCRKLDSRSHKEENWIEELNDSSLPVLRSLGMSLCSECQKMDENAAFRSLEDSEQMVELIDSINRQIQQYTFQTPAPFDRIVIDISAVTGDKSRKIISLYGTSRVPDNG